VFAAASIALWRSAPAAPAARACKIDKFAAAWLASFSAAFAFASAIGTRDYNKKSKPRNGRREIFAVACAEIPRALRLCRKLGSHARQEQGQNRDKIGAIKRVKTTTLSINYTLADEAVPIEPVSASKFPANREINREFRSFGRGSADLASNQRETSIGCSQIP
jgi:hypothetical protein